jgi:hypothetical protein
LEDTCDCPDKQLSESLEDYMEAIFHIEEQKHAARAKDIAERCKQQFFCHRRITIIV